jgi:acyl carrier protein
MMISESMTSFLSNAASEARTTLPDRDSSLFLSGVLDSFTLVDLITLIETEYDLTLKDADLRPENFDTIAKIESFISSRVAK